MSDFSSTSYQRKPEWLRVQLSSGAAYAAVQKTLQEGRLNTVCGEARCPNLHECWDRLKTATFMILGDTCTRNCRFCAVRSGRPLSVDSDEPRRVGEAVVLMGLRHAVVTMVTRDDLDDGGAAIIAETVRQIHQAAPGVGVELLISDLGGQADAIRVVMDSRPDILGHNLETVRRLTPLIRSRASYEGSLAFLAQCRALMGTEAKEATEPGTSPRPMRIKSSLMLGLGETEEEVIAAMDDLRAAGVDMLNLGQYLQPGRAQLPVVRYWTPEEFARFGREARRRGFVRVESGPLVRSSYHAEESARESETPER